MPHFSTMKKVLLSIGNFFDSGLHATFTINQLFIYNASTLYLRGRRNTANGLWHINLAHQRTESLLHDFCNNLLPTSDQPAPPSVANSIYSLEKTGYCHLPPPGMFLPRTQHLDQGNRCRILSTWPSLISKLVHVNLPKSLATAK